MLAPHRKTAPVWRRGGEDGLDVRNSLHRVDSPPSPAPQGKSEKALLSAAEERDLAQRAHSGDDRARDELIRRFEPLVVAMAKKFAAKLSLEDLIQEGEIGLIKAVDKFDPDRARLSTYARWWIAATIKDYVKKALPAATALSLNDTAGDSGDEFQDLIEADPADQEAVLIEASDIGHMRDRLTVILDAVLDDRERRIFESRRLSDNPPILDELAKEFGISRERVRQIEVRTRLKVSGEAAAPVKPIARRRKKLRWALADFYAGTMPRHRGLEVWVDAVGKRFPEAKQADRLAAHRLADKLREAIQ